MKANQAMLIAELIERGRAGWVNDPAGTGAVLVQRGTGCRLSGAKGGDIRRPERVRHPLRERLTLATFRPHAVVAEAKIRHMYLDKRGNVTVGIGHLLRNADAAVKLAFVVRGTGALAAPEHVRAAYAKVKRHRHLASRGAGPFKDLTQLDLPSDKVDRLFTRDSLEFLRLIEGKFPDFATFPPPAQLGLLDMVFTLGLRGTITGYTNFTRRGEGEELEQGGRAIEPPRPRLRPQRQDTPAIRQGRRRRAVLPRSGVPAQAAEPGTAPRAVRERATGPAPTALLVRFAERRWMIVGSWARIVTA